MSDADLADYRPLTSDDIPTAATSEAAIATKAAAARATLARMGAMDLADMLGVAS